MSGRNVLWLLITMILGACAAPENAPADTGFFVVVHIPEALVPLERGAKYEDPLGDALKARGLGEVSGGGTQLGPRKADGTHDVISIDVDVDLVDAVHGLPALREELLKLHPPPGTRLSYTGTSGAHVQEPLTPTNGS
jgi:hypothetical protein